MPDENENMIPDKIDKVIVGVLGLLTMICNGAVPIIESDPTLYVPTWATIVTGVVLPALMGYFAINGRGLGGGK